MGTEIVVGFGGGEVSPNMESRVDLDLYKASASLAENLNILPEGGSQRRAGTEFLSDAIDVDKPSVFKEFSFSDEFSYFLEFSDLQLRIWRVQDKTAIATMASPWTMLQAREVQFDRLNDVSWFTHPDVAEYRLTRDSVSGFTLEETPVEYPALLEKNNLGIILSPSVRTGSGTLTASVGTFTADDVDNIFALNQTRTADVLIGNVQYGAKVDQTGVGSGVDCSPTFLSCAFSGYSLTTTGTGWRGRLWVEESIDNEDTWEEILFIVDSTNGEEVNFRLNEDKHRPANSILRLCWDLSVAGLGYALSVQGSYNYGLAKITGYTSPTEVDIDIISDLYDTTDVSEWYEGAFSEKNGFPRCVAIHEGGRWLSGSKAEPNGVWRSRIDEYYNFQTGTLADEGIRRIPTAKGTSEFLVSKDSLLLVTSKEVITITGRTTNEGIGPENLRFVVNTGDGAAYSQGELANDAILFLQKGAKKVRDMIYSDEAQSYVTNDVSALAKHISKKGIVETAISTLPEQRFYGVTTDGQLATVSYERSESIVAWSRQITNGLFISLAVADNGEEDAIWYCVYRNGGYRIEVQKSNELDSTWHLDSAVDLGDNQAFALVEADSITVGAAPDFKITVRKVEHGLLDGRLIRMEAITGFAYLEGLECYIDDKTDDTFVLKDVSGANYLNAFDFNPSTVEVSGAGTEGANGTFSRYDDLIYRMTLEDDSFYSIMRTNLGWEIGFTEALGAYVILYLNPSQTPTPPYDGYLIYTGLGLQDVAISDFVNLVEQLDADTDFSVTFSASKRGVIAGGYNGNGFPNGYMIIYYDGASELQCGIGQPTGPTDLIKIPYVSGTIVTIRCRGNGEVYLNGLLAGTGLSTSSPVGSFVLGLYNVDAGGLPWSGQLEKCIIYDVWLNGNHILPGGASYFYREDDIGITFPATEYIGSSPSATPATLTEVSSPAIGLAPTPTVFHENSLILPITGSYSVVYSYIPNLDHLEGMEVTALIDGKFLETHTVEDGQIVLNRLAVNVIAGLRYSFLLSPLPIESLNTIISLGHVKMISDVVLKLNGSYGGECGTDLENMEPILTRTLADPLGEIPELVSGDILLNPVDGWESTKRLYVRHDLPYPFEVLSLSLNVQTTKGRG